MALLGARLLSAILEIDGKGVLERLVGVLLDRFVVALGCHSGSASLKTCRTGAGTMSAPVRRIRRDRGAIHHHPFDETPYSRMELSGLPGGKLLQTS